MKRFLNMLIGGVGTVTLIILIHGIWNHFSDPTLYLAIIFIGVVAEIWLVSWEETL